MNKVNQQLKIQLDELKSLPNDNSMPGIFRLDYVSFNVDDVFDYECAKERLIIGRIFPMSEIFNEGAFEIEIKLSSVYPFNPPKVYFRTPIYHPNVDENGQFHHELLSKTALWSNTTSLVDIVRTIVDRIDTPDADYLIDQEVAKEYTHDRAIFNRKALEIIRQYSLSRI